MRESFISTFTIDAEPHILRFILHPTGHMYKVCTINLPNLPPFEMTRTDDGSWRILGKAVEKYVQEEPTLAHLICSSN